MLVLVGPPSFVDRFFFLDDFPGFFYFLFEIRFSHVFSKPFPCFLGDPVLRFVFDEITSFKGMLRFVARK